MKKSLLLLLALCFSVATFAQEENKPATPTNLQAILMGDNMGGQRIKLVWDKVDSVNYYNIYDDVNSEEPIKIVATTEFMTGSLAFGEEFCYCVSALKEGANGEEYESDRTEPVCTTIVSEPCDQPTNLKANVVYNAPGYGKKYKITLTWDAVEGAELYAVYASSKNVPEGTWAGDVYTNKWEWGLDLEGELHFRVKTICDADIKFTSDFSSEEVTVILSEDMEDASAVKTPENVVATAKSETSVEIKWDAVENAQSYFVYYNDEEIANIKETSYIHKNLSAGNEYCYTVTAMGESKESERSEEACVITLGLEELRSSLNIYPNPANDKLFIEANVNIEEVAIYTITGVLVGQQTTDNSQQTLSIDVANLNSGVYFVKINTENGEIVKRFVKE